VSETTAGHSDPRRSRSRQRVLDAAAALLTDHGPAAVTIDAVAQRSGVAKTTVYRQWSHREDLLVDVFLHLTPPADLPDVPLAQWLDHQMVTLARLLRESPFSSVLPAVLDAVERDPGAERLRDRFLQAQIEPALHRITQARDDGRVPPELDPEELVEALAGPLLFRGALLGRPVDDERARRHVRRTLAAFGLGEP
jgi:AcrR family transcriptional regulator